MLKKILFLFCVVLNSFQLSAQINTDRVTIIGRNALYYEDYILSIQYFNQVIKAKPHLPEPYYYRAIAKFYLDDIKGTEEDCSMAITRNPFYIDAYQLRADARLNLEKFDDAIKDYKTSLAYSPDNKFALVHLGVSSIQVKDFPQAEENLNTLLRLYPKYTDGILTRGTMYLEKGDTLKAIQDYDRAIEVDKYYSPSFSRRGLLRYQMKDYDKALADLDEAIKLDPLLVGNYINRGLVKYSQEDLRGAMADYDQVLEKESGNIIARFNRGLLRARVGDDNRAIEDFDIVIEHEPDNYSAYLNRSILKENISDDKGAMDDLNKVLQMHPDFYQGIYMRSEIKRRANDLKGAERDFLLAQREENKAIKRAFTENASPESPKEKAADPATREQSDKTIDKFNLLVVADVEEQEKSRYSNQERGRVQNRQVKIELEPKFVVSYYDRPSDVKNVVRTNTSIEAINKESVLSRRILVTNTEMPLSQKQIDVHFASIDEYSKLIAEHPNNANFYFGRGLDYMLVQNLASAIEDFNKAVELSPSFTLAYFNLAVSYTKQMDLNQYISTYSNNIDMKSLSQTKKDESQGIATLASPSLTSENEQRDYYLIIKNYNKVIELDPKFVYAYYNKGDIHSMQKDYRAAILDYNAAIKQEPEFPEAYFNRGLAKLQIGEKEKGLDDLRKAGELGVVNAYNIIKRMAE